MPQELTTGHVSLCSELSHQAGQDGGDSCPWKCTGRPAESHRGPTEGASKSEKTGMTALTKAETNLAECPLLHPLTQ